MILNYKQSAQNAAQEIAFSEKNLYYMNVDFQWGKCNYINLFNVPIGSDGLGKGLHHHWSFVNGELKLYDDHKQSSIIRLESWSLGNRSLSAYIYAQDKEEFVNEVVKVAIDMFEMYERQMNYESNKFIEAIKELQTLKQ